jgi:hypothetical protein
MLDENNTPLMNIKIGDKKISELTPTNLADIAIIEDSPSP